MHNLFAQSTWFDLPAMFYFAVRVGIAMVAGLIGWFLAGPIVGIISRLFFQKPVPRAVESLSRIVGTVALALLAFYLIPIGPGGWGSGWGPGGGGNGGKNGTGKGASTPGDGGDGNKTGGPADGPKTGKKILEIEIVTRKHYVEGSKRFYLINKEGPAQTIGEVRKFLDKTKGDWRQIDIILYSDSANEEDPAVTDLRNVAQEFGLKTAIPPEYFNKKKPGD